MERPSSPAVVPTDFDRAFASGVFDGEGCVYLARLRPQSSAGRPALNLQTVVVNTNLELLEWLHARWGGYIYGLNRRGPNDRAAWQWRLSGGRLAGCFLKDIAPYAIDKREIIANAINFTDLQAAHRGRYGRNPMPDDIYQRQHEFWLKHRELMTARTSHGRPPRKDRSWAGA
jgi:hypothetical protein